VTLKVVGPAGRLVGISILYSLRVTLTVLSAAFTAETLRLAANNRVGTTTPKNLSEQNVMTFSFQMAQMPFSCICIYVGVLRSWEVSKTRQRQASERFVAAGCKAAFFRGFSVPPWTRGDFRGAGVATNPPRGFAPPLRGRGFSARAS